MVAECLEKPDHNPCGCSAGRHYHRHCVAVSTCSVRRYATNSRGQPGCRYLDRVCGRTADPVVAAGCDHEFADEPEWRRIGLAAGSQHHQHVYSGCEFVGIGDLAGISASGRHAAEATLVASDAWCRCGRRCRLLAGRFFAARPSLGRAYWCQYSGRGNTGRLWLWRRVSGRADSRHETVFPAQTDKGDIICC